MTKIKSSNLFITIVFLYCSCIHSMNERSSTFKELLSNAKKGDVSAYNEIKIMFLDYNPKNLLPIAKYMADSAKYSYANVDVVNQYFEIYNRYPDDSLDLLKVDSIDGREIMKYYNRAIKLNERDIFQYKLINAEGLDLFK